MDDVIQAGDKEFDVKVVGPLKKAFICGSIEEEDFRYVGLNMMQTTKGIVVDQGYYVKALGDVNMC